MQHIPLAKFHTILLFTIKVIHKHLGGSLGVYRGCTCVDTTALIPGIWCIHSRALLMLGGVVELIVSGSLPPAEPPPPPPPPVSPPDISPPPVIPIDIVDNIPRPHSSLAVTSLQQTSQNRSVTAHTSTAKFLSQDHEGRLKSSLTLWRPLLQYGYSYKGSGVKQIFVIFDIRALWRSALSVKVPGCQKLQMMA